MGRRDYEPVPETKISDEGPLIKGQREPSYAFRWYWSNERKDHEDRKTHSATISLGGDTILAIGLPDLYQSGRAWFYANHDKIKWHIEWGFNPGKETRLSFGASIDGEDRDLMMHVRIPWLGYFFLVLDSMVPKSWIPSEHRTYTTYEPYVFASKEEAKNAVRKPVKHEYDMGMDVDLISFDLAGDHISFSFMNVSDHMQCDGTRRWYAFWPDKIFGRSEYTSENVGDPVIGVACFPEGKYELVLQRQLTTWKRSRWPWPCWRKSINIDAKRPPEFHGKGENSYDCGPDAIYGMSSDGWDYEHAIAKYTETTLKERRRRGVLSDEHKSILTPVGSEI